jgi:hypothetical protein
VARRHPLAPSPSPARPAGSPYLPTDSRAVEEAIDEVNTEYLDLLMDLTGAAYMGCHEIAVDPSVRCIRPRRSGRR